MPTETALLPALRAVALSEAGAAGWAGSATPDGITVVGVPVLSSDGSMARADGVPDRLALGTAQVELVVDDALCTRRGFSAKSGEVLVSGDGPVTVVLLGCGPAGDVSADVIRRAAAAFVRNGGRDGRGLLVLPRSMTEPAGGALRTGQAVAEGVLLASYRYDAHRGEASPGVLAEVVVAADPAGVADGLERGTTVAEAVRFARDLVNEPPSTMTPALLAAAVTAHLQGRPGLELEVWDAERITQERLGGLLGVARGSNEEPRLLRASYQPPSGGRPVPHVVLVGKGITFDSGGLSLKTAEGMMTMKTDMSGAAAVMAAVGAAAALGLAVRVTAIAPVTENMPGGRAIKPGDVLTIRDGQTIEVLNTDAEGRLVLSDGLTLARELEPDAIVDLATLTGACVVALGGGVAGVFSNDDGLGAQVLEASQRAGEPMWPLPLVEEYRSHIDSEVADMKNIGKAGQAGAIAAALLLERFVDDVPWAHLDIAGPARSDEDSGLLTKGGTGFGVRTLVELLDRFRPTNEPVTTD